MRPLGWLFSAQGASETDIVRWWELRRIPYNLIVGAIGVVSLGVMAWVMATLVVPGEDGVEPLGMLTGVFIVGLALNLYYTQAWVAERHGAAAGDHRGYRERQFRRRLVRSCQIVTLPVWIALLAWVVHKLTR